MAREASLDHQDGGSSKKQVGAQMGFGFHEPRDHPLKRNDPMADVGFDMDVIEPARFGADAHAVEGSAVSAHGFDRRHLENGEVADEGPPPASVQGEH